MDSFTLSGYPVGFHNENKKLRVQCPYCEEVHTTKLTEQEWLSKKYHKLACPACDHEFSLLGDDDLME